MTSAHLSPLDQALANRPRGKPRTGNANKDVVPKYPIDFDPAVAKTETAQKVLTGVKKVWETFAKLDSEGMNRQEIAKNAKPALERAYASVDEATGKLKAQRAAAERDIQRAIDKGANPALAVEVRKHVQSLGMKAIPFVNERINAGDTTTVSAVLNAPPFLSGLTDASFGTLRVAAQRKLAPEKVDEIAIIDRDIERIDNAGSRLLGVIGGRAKDWADAHAETLKGLSDEP
jgi:hypothetical protein